MTISSALHRRLYMHSAHSTVGVSSLLSNFCKPQTQESVPELEITEPLTVTLVSGELSGRMAALLLGFQRILQNRFQIDCRCTFVDVAEGGSELGDIEPTACTVLLYHGITILHDRNDWDPDWLCNGIFASHNGVQPELTVMPHVLRHEVLQNVGLITVQQNIPVLHDLPVHGAGVLWAKEGETKWPVAWIDESNGRRMFHTSLGGDADFRQPNFCRMLTNAVAWVSGGNTL
jgi:hypothetical protein